MLNLSSFKDSTALLHKKVVDLIERVSPDDVAKVNSLFNSKDVVLNVAFVGQYNAGKSSILKALTGNQEIKIDSNICTDDVAAYKWNHIQVLDTPGIHAGRSDHDQTTYSAIDKSDLLIFVITNELFDDVIGKHFQQLAFERHKAKEMLLVVNKMSRDSGTENSKLPSLLPVLEPMLPEDFNTTFIDAECYLDAIDEEDEEDKAELLHESNFDSLVKSINSFVEKKGLLGQLTTPLSSMQTAVRNIREAKSVTRPEEKILIELLHRRLAILREGEQRLKSTMNDMLDSTLTKVRECGDELAELISENSTETEIKSKSEEVESRCKGFVDKLSLSYVETVKEHIERVSLELEQLEQSQLAKALNDAIETIASDVNAEQIDSVSSTINFSEYDPASNERNKKIVKWAKSGLDFTSNSAKGVNATAQNIGTAAGTSGSVLHNGVKVVGKFFGVKFKPWQAVNIAKNIGNVARYLGPVLSIIGIGLQIYDDVKQEEQRTTMRDARADIRKEFRLIAQNLMRQFEEGISNTVEGVHGELLEKTQLTLNEITEGNIQNNQELSELKNIELELSALIVKIQES